MSWWDDKTLEEKAEICRRRSESNIRAWADMDPTVKAEMLSRRGRSLSETCANRSPEEKARISAVNSEARLRAEEDILPEARIEINSKISEAGKKRWASMTQEERDSISSKISRARSEFLMGMSLDERGKYLELSFHSEESKEKGLKVRMDKTPDEKAEIVRKRLSTEGYSIDRPKSIQSYFANITEEDREARGWSREGYFDGYGCYWWAIRESVLVRDNYVCQICNSGEDLCVHHIDHDTYNSEDTNLITLCSSCHAQEPGHSEWKGLFSSKLLGCGG